MIAPDVNSRRDAVRSGAVAVSVLLLLGVGWLLWHTANAQLGLEFVAPDGYIGYLAARWECPGGVPLERNALGGFREQQLAFDARGTACIVEPIPSHGYRMLGFVDAQGSPLPVIVGGTRALELDTGAGRERFVYSPLASLGVGNGQILGDECTLRDFLEAGFAMPERGGPCDPIYVLPNPALPATPGAPAGP